ncbi:hypothetical protein BDA99DRAFT_275213 [Phascolomyces articulosus]|uniref:Galactose oxidase n=1 Tax=Phascolomyces articulosus TaxID=60185 RepID=A0AAD5KJ87_9FUNG|nr:hypothetical protein BDA99DRAFT_275213 [Phascolomyces articulosus]
MMSLFLFLHGKKATSCTLLVLLSFLIYSIYYFDTITVCAQQQDDDTVEYILTAQPVVSNPLINPRRRTAATFVRNNIIYVWGGDGYYTADYYDITPYFNAINIATEPDDNDQKILKYSFVSNSRDYHNFSVAASAIVDPTNNDRVLFFGGTRNSYIGAAENETLYLEQYDFTTTQWTTLPVVAEQDGVSIDPPKNRIDFSAIVLPSNGNIYIAGGYDNNSKNSSASLDDNNTLIWMYDPVRQVFSPASQNDTLVIQEKSRPIYGFLLE